MLHTSKKWGFRLFFQGTSSNGIGITDVTDSGMLAKHLEWAALTPAAHNQAFHVVNGDVFRWKWMWPRIASFWHTDGDLLRPFEVITDMSKSRKPGFAEYKATDQVFFDLFERLRLERIIH